MSNGVFSLCATSLAILRAGDDYDVQLAYAPAEWPNHAIVREAAGAADHEERRADPCGRTRRDAQLCAGGQGEESGSEGLGVIDEKVRTTNVLQRMGMREMGREATVS